MPPLQRGEETSLLKPKMIISSKYFAVACRCCSRLRQGSFAENQVRSGDVTPVLKYTKWENVALPLV
jgi:hypothetical protein